MIALLILYVLLPLIQLLLFLSGQFALEFLDILNFSASIFAFHWLLANVIIASKVPMLQKTIPYDLRIRFHILSSAGIVFAVAFHAIYKFYYEYYMNVVTWALLVVIVALMVSAILWIPLPLFKAFRTRVLSLFKGSPDYDKSKLLHVLFVLLVVTLLLFHVISADLFGGVGYLSLALYLVLYTVTFGLLVISKLNLFRVKSVVEESNQIRDIITLKLKPIKYFKYRAGQFTFLESVESKKRMEEHPFSFLSFPRDTERETVSLAIRAIGDFTNSLTELNPGDFVNLKGAYGNFRLKQEQNICLIASGIGSVPIISILKDLYHRGDNRRVEVFLSVRHRDELLEIEQIIEIEKRMENVTLHLLISSEEQVRFSEPFFREMIKDPKSFSYYMCCSPAVRTVVVNALRNLEVKKSNIHYESFTLG